MSMEINVNTVSTSPLSDTIHMFPAADISEEHLEVKNQHTFSFKTSVTTNVMMDIIGFTASTKLLRATTIILGDLLFPQYNQYDISSEIDHEKVAKLWLVPSILYSTIQKYVDNHPFVTAPILLIRIFIHGKDLVGMEVGTFLSFRVEYMSEMVVSYTPEYIIRTPEQYLVKIFNQCMYITEKLKKLVVFTHTFKTAFDTYIGYTDTTTYPVLGWGHTVETNDWERMLLRNKNEISMFLDDPVRQNIFNELSIISMRISMFINWVYIDMNSSLNMFPLPVQNYMCRNMSIICTQYIQKIKDWYEPMYILSSTSGRILRAFVMDNNTVLGWESYMFAYGHLK